MHKVDSIIFSDLHFGTLQSNITITKIKSLIKLYNPKWLIFAGDTADLYVSKSNIKYINELKNLDCDNIYFLRGNHDNIIEHHENLEIEVNDKNIFIFHGHQYDSKLTKAFDKIATKLNEFIYKLFKISIQLLIKFIYSVKYNGRRYYIPSLKQRSKILNEYINYDYDVVITGHTHYEEHVIYKNFEYINLGDWNFYCIVYEDGKLELKRL